ncbi:protein of unknown function (plasmid) [Azospirillum lipoferum 4B]|uniref:Uncharacterized protein n=1 Tax=Azospirillum lipoferum (strain 4B) TaxID=862719 RepID=G7ZEE4_AZOL4|nr:protein of unknown function [Azospirillum lipoferum 4B]
MIAASSWFLEPIAEFAKDPWEPKLRRRVVVIRPYSQIRNGRDVPVLLGGRNPQNH